MIGFCERPNYQKRVTPLLIVTNEESASDVFSWTATYSPNVFPLSQFARVISDFDWEFLRSLPDEKSNQYTHEDMWASLVFGELLAQSDGEQPLSGIPFSRANACYSTAVARASLIYPKYSSAFKTCLNRLKKIELDRSFVPRPVSVSLLAGVWDTLHTHEYRIDSFYASTEGLITESIALLLSRQKGNRANADLLLSDFTELQSESIEERMLGFNKFLRKLEAKGGGEIADSRVNALIASAAFLVGRGTSHIFLLRRLSRIFPSAVLWFGTLAALVGPSCWDEHWLRAVKGIEKYLRAKFNWDEPSLSDLSWHEYAWFSDIYASGEYLDDLSKNSPNVLSVEIIPGATCQMRLASSVGKVGELEKSAREDAKNLNQKELELVVGQLVALASKAQDLVKPKNSLVLDKSSSLFEGEPVLSSKAPRKRARGGSGFDR